MIGLVEKEFFKVVRAEQDKCSKNVDSEFPKIRVMRLVAANGYWIHMIHGELRISLASSRKETRRFAKLETARALLKSYGISVFTVIDIGA
jgi:hypothetical protein